MSLTKKQKKHDLLLIFLSKMPYAVINMKIEYVSDKDRTAIERKVIDFAKSINRKNDDEWMKPSAFKKTFGLTDRQMDTIREKSRLRGYGLIRQSKDSGYIYNASIYREKFLTPAS